VNGHPLEEPSEQTPPSEAAGEPPSDDPPSGG